MRLIQTTAIVFLVIGLIFTAACDSAQGPAATPTATPEPTLSGVPVLIAPDLGETVTDFNVSFDWWPMEGADGYKMVLSDDPDFDFDVDYKKYIEIPVIDNYADVSAESLNDGINYWRVRAFNSVSESPWSDTGYFYLILDDNEEAGVPGLIAPDLDETVNNTKPTFSWTPVEGATKYRFELDNNIDFGSLVYTVSPANAGVTLPSGYELSIGTQYYWHVKSLKPVEGDWSETGYFTVESVPATATPTPAPTYVLPDPEEVMYGYLYVYISCNYLNEACVGCTISADFYGQDLTGGEYPVTGVVLKVNGQELFDSGAISETRYDGTASMSAGCGQTYDFELIFTNSIGLEGVVTETVVAQTAE